MEGKEEVRCDRLESATQKNAQRQNATHNTQDARRTQYQTHKSTRTQNSIFACTMIPCTVLLLCSILWTCVASFSKNLLKLFLLHLFFLDLFLHLFLLTFHCTMIACTIFLLLCTILWTCVESFSKNLQTFSYTPFHH